MRLLGRDIPAPQPDPSGWAGLVDDCARCVAAVVNVLRDAGVAEPDTLKACESALVAALLTDLWRDVRTDVMAHDRLYIPADLAREQGLDLALMRKALRLDTDRGCAGDARDGSCNCANIPNTGLRVVLPAYRRTMRGLIERTGAVWDAGGVASGRLPEPFREQMRVMRQEVAAMLWKIAARRYDTLTRRPVIGPIDRAWLRVRAFLPM